MVRKIVDSKVLAARVEIPVEDPRDDPGQRES